MHVQQGIGLSVSPGKGLIGCQKDILGHIKGAAANNDADRLPEYLARFGLD
jgi:sigma54-dependent transcription regulator